MTREGENVSQKNATPIAEHLAETLGALFVGARVHRWESASLSRGLSERPSGGWVTLPRTTWVESGSTWATTGQRTASAPKPCA